MKRAVLMFLIIGIICFKSSGSDNSKVVGSWKVEVSDAPYEYSNSTIVITEAEGKLTAKVVFVDGTAIKASSVSCQGENIKLSMNIEGYDVIFNGKVTGNKMTGSVETPDGNMTAIAEKVTLNGTWLYKAPDAPYEYSEGKFVFTELNGKPALKIILGSYEVPVSDLKVTNGTSFSFNVDVEGETVAISGSLLNGKISAKAESSQGEIRISAAK
jgi:hypothetical protein